jgi:hypothetical protein
LAPRQERAFPPRRMRPLQAGEARPCGPQRRSRFTPARGLSENWLWWLPCVWGLSGFDDIAFSGEHHLQTRIKLFFTFFCNAASPLRRFAVIAFVGATLSSAPSSQAQVIFFDNFDANNPGLNVVPAGWTIANTGTVDLIGVCNGNPPFFDFFPGNGCYVDLDGSTNSPGLLKKSFTLSSGIPYLLQFDLASTQNNIVDVAFGTTTGQYSFVGTMPIPFSTKSLSFTPATTGLYDISFFNQGGDNNGVSLKNVELSAVPAPLPLLGPIAAFSARRRLRSFSRQLRG